MPSVQPTCAARVVQNSYLKYGWGVTLTKDANDMVRKVKNDAGGCYQMQLSRSRPVSSTSLHSALFWAHRHLDDQRIVSTPAIDDDVELFSHEKSSFKDALKRISNKPHGTRPQLQLHPLFGPIRDRSFTLWPIRIDGTWVTVILQVEQVPAIGQAFGAFFDREVKKCVIVDPLPKGRRSRRALVGKRLPKVLAEGCISLPKTAISEDLAIANIQDSWATGHVAFAVCREFLRRLKVLSFRRKIQAPEETTDFLWTAFEEAFDVDEYRESIMAACAHQTIEKSHYLIRIALEVPSEKSEHNPDDLSPFKAKSVTSFREELQDELYMKSRTPDSAVFVEIPGQIQAPTQPVNDLSDESEYDDSDSDESEEESDSEDDKMEVEPKEQSINERVSESANITVTDVPVETYLSHPKVEPTKQSEVATVEENAAYTPETQSSGLDVPTFQPTIWGQPDSEPSGPTMQGMSFDLQGDAQLGGTPDHRSNDAPWTPSSPRSPRSQGEGEIYTSTTTEEITVTDCGQFDGDITMGDTEKHGLSDDEGDREPKRMRLGAD